MANSSSHGFGRSSTTTPWTPMGILHNVNLEHAQQFQLGIDAVMSQLSDQLEGVSEPEMQAFEEELAGDPVQPLFAVQYANIPGGLLILILAPPYTALVTCIYG